MRNLRLGVGQRLDIAQSFLETGRPSPLLRLLLDLFELIVSD